MVNWNPSPVGPLDGSMSAIVFSIGLIASLSLLLRLLSFLWLYFLQPSKLHRYLHDTDGKPAWALVTGASDGIGKQLAHELARHGFNVVLHGRNPAKLARVQDELAAAFPDRAFRPLIADCAAIACHSCRTKSTQGGDHHVVDFDAIAASLSDINLTVLINNAGGNWQPIYQYLQDIPEEKLVALIALNAVFPLALQSKLLPQLIRNSPALIMNIGSMSDLGLPMLSPYASSKRFGTCMTECVARELVMQGRDVEVLGIRVGEVCGTTYNKSAASLFEPDAATMARAALARVGCGRTTVIGYWAHALQVVGLHLAPKIVQERSIQDVIRTRWKEDQLMMKSQ